METKNTPSPKKIDDMSVTRFLDCVCEEIHAYQRFCFILGSGASYTSGIRTGIELMKHWRTELEEKGQDYIKECAQAANYEWDECKRIFDEPLEKLKNEDYFTLYDIRFVGCPTAGYAALEKEMEGHSPNVGYYYLASILANTDNRLVITTNFDSLTEDALFYYSGHHPLVLGHEKLASYVASVDRKPVVAKIHRDLLMDPMNHKEQMQRLQDEWKGPLSSALSRYVPIVIGYAGGDQTLMSLLEQLQLKGIFWCTLEKDGENGFPEKARQIVEKNHGHWVKIKGFDELMYRMATRMEEMPDLNEMREAMDVRHEAFKSRHEALTKEYDPSRMKEGTPEAAKEDAGMLQAVLQEEGSKDPDLQEYNLLLSRALLCWSKNDITQAIDICEKAIDLNPELATAYEYRGALHHRMENYDLALADATKAIACDAEDAGHYHSRAVTLHAMGRYEEALADRNKAVELQPDNARYYDQRAVTLYEMKRYDDALADSNEAVKLRPGNAKYYHSRAVTLHAMQQYDDALTDRNMTVELQPDNARYYDQRATTLYKMERYDDALADSNKAVELQPDNARYHSQRAATLYKMERYDDALADSNKAVELQPDNARYYNQRATILYKMERYGDALADSNKAVGLQPDNARYYDQRATTLYKMERYDDALANSNKAVELQPDNARYYDHRSATLHKMERYDDALADSNKAVELQPDNAEFWLNRGDLFKKMNREEEAEQCFAKAESLEKK